jgi:benzylsuccinate CoA-transferase BbsF subunit
MKRLPLEGIRVLDFTTVWAGPYGGGLLARLGAEVIMVEMPFRKAEAFSKPGAESTAAAFAGLRDFETYSLFCDMGKKSICVNLKHTGGPALVRQLAGVSDVVIENFGGPRVMQKFGLGYDDLAAINPRIIYCGMPAMGMTGPEKDYVAFGVSIEQLSGIVSLQGYEGSEAPQKSGINYGDPIAGMTACGAIVTALIQRERTGRGQLIDLSQREAAASLIGEAVLDWSMNRRPPSRHGNRHPLMAPHNLYRTAGDDEWLMIACRDDADWLRLVDAIGDPGLASDARFATMLDRRRNEPDLDRAIGARTATRDAAELERRLQAAAVPAARVKPVNEIPSDPHASARGMWRSLTYPHNGKTYPLQQPPWIFRREPPREVRRAPFRGEHTAEVLALVGREGEMMALIETGVVGRPEGTGRAIG